MHLCKQGDSGNKSDELRTARETRGRWKYYIHIYSQSIHKYGRDSLWFGEDSASVHKKGRSVPHPGWKEEILGRLLSIESQRELRRYEVNHSSSSPVFFLLSLSLSLSLSLKHTHTPAAFLYLCLSFTPAAFFFSLSLSVSLSLSQTHTHTAFRSFRNNKEERKFYKQILWSLHSYATYLPIAGERIVGFMAFLAMRNANILVQYLNPGHRVDSQQRYP